MGSLRLKAKLRTEEVPSIAPNIALSRRQQDGRVDNLGHVGADLEDFERGQSDELCGDLNGLFGVLGFSGGSPCGSPSLLRLMIMVLAMGAPIVQYW